MADSRLAFDIIARGGNSAAAEFEKVARGADKAGSSMKKNATVSDLVAKATANLTKAHNAESNALDKVQVAESRLSNVRETAKAKTAAVKDAETQLLRVRADTSSKASEIAAAESKLERARSAARTSTTQVIAGEKALSKARREAAVAGNDAQKAAKELSKVLTVEGEKAGKGFLGGLQSSGRKVPGVVKNWFTNSKSDVGIFKQAGANAGNGFLGALSGALKTPVIGPILAVTLVAAVEAVAVPTGAILAGGIVAGFGAGIGALGLVFAAKSAVIKAIWSKTASDLGAQMRTISKPFESTLAAMSVVARRTFATFKPQLAAAFKTLAPAATAFGDQLGQAFAKLAPAIQPLAKAFSGVLANLGPALQAMLTSVSQGLILLSQSIQKSPAALGDFVRGVGDITRDLLIFLTVMNDANESFRRFTGGTSAVSAFMRALEIAVLGVIGPIAVLAKGLSEIGDGMNWAAGKLGVGKQVMDQSAASATHFSDGLLKTVAGLTASAEAGLHNAHATHVANAAAALLAGAFDRQTAATQKTIDAMNRLSSRLLSLTGAQIDYAQAVADATQAIKDNGHTHDLSTQKGRDNARALLAVANAAIAQRDGMLKANDGLLSSAKSAEASRVTYAQLAVGMGHTAAEAKRMAAEAIKIPPVTSVTVKADIKDLQTKLAQAETALKSPHLTATKKAKIQADIANIKAGIATSKRLLADLPQSRTARIQANIADLEAKLKTATGHLNDKNLTKDRKARLLAEISNLEANIRKAKGELASVPGSKTVTITTRLVTERIAKTVSGATGGHVPTEARAGGGPVKAGQPYLVGEQGPEIVVPKNSGTVIPNNAIKTGSNVVAGLAQGALGSAASAYSAVAQVAAGMISKAQDVLGISSPSKAFAKLGLYVTQGFAIGLRGSAKQVQSVMASLMSKVLDIAFNAADTKKAAQKNIAAYTAAISAARKRIRPITSGMSKAEADKTRRNNAAAAASIKSLQTKLASAKVDLANVNSIASKLGTTKKRNAVIGMIQRENVAMQKLANARAAVASQLSAAQAKLADAIQVREDFKKQITDAAMSFNSIANIQAPEGGQLTAQGIIAAMTETLRKTQQFAAKLAQLKKSGLNSTTYQQIAEAGVEQGGSIADALLSGGGNTFNSINRLQSNINSAAAGLGDTAAKNLYQAGVDAAQGLVNGLLAKTAALDAASKKLAAAIVAQIKKTLGIRSPSKVLEWHGSMAGKGFAQGILGEYGNVRRAGAGLGNAAQPGAQARRGGTSSGGGRGGDIYITVNGALDPNAVALQIQQLLKRYTRTGGVAA